MTLSQGPEKGGPLDETGGQFRHGSISSAGVEGFQDFGPHKLQAMDMKIDVHQDLRRPPLAEDRGADALGGKE